MPQPVIVDMQRQVGYTDDVQIPKSVNEGVTPGENHDKG